MQQRIYIVKDKRSDQPRLVMAPNPAQALRHITHSLFEVKAANATEVAELMTADVPLEKSKADQVTGDLLETA